MAEYFVSFVTLHGVYIIYAVVAIRHFAIKDLSHFKDDDLDFFYATKRLWNDWIVAKSRWALRDVKQEWRLLLRP